LGGVGAGTLNLGKHLEWRDRYETWWEKQAQSPKHVTEITRTDSLSLDELGVGLILKN